ncbi:hypothetical protein [Cryptosporangium arvum]|uniref:hypothetical protein n=1 Tax=Cryptosporangium arvum TaxID=80871 RepID=UPI0004AEEB92|nr:hypothetical protein [Cryptosporangium arvum]
MSLPLPPSDAGDAELWLAGYELRAAHRPADGSAECPICHTNWECAAYRNGVEMMRSATEGPPSPLEDRWFGRGRALG